MDEYGRVAVPFETGITPPEDFKSRSRRGQVRRKILILVPARERRLQKNVSPIPDGDKACGSFQAPSPGRTVLLENFRACRQPSWFSV